MSSIRALSLFLVLLLVSCVDGETRVEEAMETRIYHVENGSEPQGLDPHVTTGVPEQRIQWAIFEGLVTMDTDGLKILPGVAERWEISEDQKTYRFYLRDNAKWSNGDSVTAEDFRWSWQRSLSPETANRSAYMLYPIKNAEPFVTGELTDFSQVGVRVIDTYIFEVELSNPTPYFLQLLDHHTAAPVHRPTIEKYGTMTQRYTGWTRPGSIVSNGPFVLEDWAINRYVKVRKSDTYWDKDNVWLEGVHYYPVESYSSSERMFRAGQLHQTYEVLTDKVPVYRADRPDAIRVNPYIGTYYYEINTRTPPLDDVRVRKALAMSIDRELLISSTLNGVNMPAYTIVPPGTLGYQPPVLFGFDPEKARELLAEAGFPNGEGFPTFELLYNTNEAHRQVAEAIQQMWKTYLNVDVELINQEWKVYIDSRNEYHFDIVRAGWIGDYVDPKAFISMWITDGGSNDSGWSNEEYDDLVMRVIPESKTHEERLENFYKAESIVLSELPFIPIYTYQTKYLMHESVKGSHPNLMDKFNYKQIYFE